MPFVNTQFPPRTPVIVSVTAGQSQIPAGALDWSVQVVTGSAFVGATGPFQAGTRFQGDCLPTPLNVGCTGGQAAVLYFTPLA